MTPDVAMAALRERALAFVPPSGPTLASILGTLTEPLTGPAGSFGVGHARFFFIEPPEGLRFGSTDPQAPQFFALGTIDSAREGEIDGGGLEAFVWEVQILARPRSAQPAALRAGTLLTQAYLNWRHPSGRLWITDAPLPVPRPRNPDAANREIVGTVARYGVRCMPEPLTAVLAA